MAQSLYASQQCLTLDKGFEQMNRGDWSLQGFLLKPSTSVTPGHYSFAPPCHGTFNIFGQGIGVDNKVGEVGCPGREGESVRINKESNDMEINFSWLVFLALLAVIMRMKKDSWSKKKEKKKKKFPMRWIQKTLLQGRGAPLVRLCDPLSFLNGDTNWGKCRTFQMCLMERCWVWRQDFQIISQHSNA